VEATLVAVTLDRSFTLLPIFSNDHSRFDPDRTSPDFQSAEVAIPRTLFADILGPMPEMRPLHDPALT
jgi:hypothetical protein